MNVFTGHMVGGVLVLLATALALLIVRRGRLKILLAGLLIAGSPAVLLVGAAFDASLHGEGTWFVLQIVQALLLAAGLCLLGSALVTVCQPPKRQVVAGVTPPRPSAPARPHPRSASSPPGGAAFSPTGVAMRQPQDASCWSASGSPKPQPQ